MSLGLSCFLLPGGRHFITSFGNLPSSILWTCPYHWSCLICTFVCNNSCIHSLAE
jgi:hypothetical protein